MQLVVVVVVSAAEVASAAFHRSTGRNRNHTSLCGCFDAYQRPNLHEQNVRPIFKIFYDRLRCSFCFELGLLLKRRTFNSLTKSQTDLVSIDTQTTGS